MVRLGPLVGLSCAQKWGVGPDGIGAVLFHSVYTHTKTNLKINSTVYAIRGTRTAQSIAERGGTGSRSRVLALRLMGPRPYDSGMATPRVRATVKAAAAPSSALDLCGCPQHALLATRRRHGVQVREQLCRRALHARADGLDVADHLLCEGAVCTRVCDRVLMRCHAAPKRCGSELVLEL